MYCVDAIPGFESGEPWGTKIKNGINPERVRQPPNPFRVQRYCVDAIPGFSFLEPRA